MSCTFDESSSEVARVRTWCIVRLVWSLLRNSVRPRHDNAELVTVGIGEHHPTDVTVTGSSHEIPSQLQSSFRDVIRIVGIELNVRTTANHIVDISALKRQVRPSTGRVAQTHTVFGECSLLIPSERGPELAEPFRI